jgi:hypothetical protein
MEWGSGAILPVPIMRIARHGVVKIKRKMVRLAGIEPATLGFGGQYSIH